ncbi:helix-turn-helix domain-containing protein [Candidatus Riflebacteria bacterium]
MPIIIKLDVVLAENKMLSNELSKKIGITPVNLSKLKKGKIKAIRLSTLEKICKELKCQPGDLLIYKETE